jgi:putative acetyltransferase
VRIRPYAPSDLEPLVALFTASVHALAAAHYDEAQLSAWAPLSSDIAHWSSRFQAGETLVAEQGALLAGFLTFGADGHIDLLYTHPDFARRGVASRLYARAEEALVRSGARELSTEASQTARPFFESRGFRVVEEQEVVRGDATLRRFAMRKSLDPAP